MANERQFFRDINPGDVSIEGRKSNGVTADINGNTIIYAGIKQSELQKLNQEKYLGNVPIDGYTSTFIAALAPGQLPPYPAGNNNNETYFESKKTDPNKIIVATQPTGSKPITQVTQSLQPVTSSLPRTEVTASKPAPDVEGGFVFLEETGFAIEPVQLTGDIDYYREVEIVDGLLQVLTKEYSVQIKTQQNNDRKGINKTTNKKGLDVAKELINKAIAKYPMITDKTKYPDALNRLLAMCLVAYNETSLSLPPVTESPNHTFNTAKRAKILKGNRTYKEGICKGQTLSGFDTLETFYAKFGVKPGEESKKDSGNAHTARPQDIFNSSYGCRYGNGDEASGDGFKYRGRGFNQTTFKDAYEKAGQVVYNDKNLFVNNPELINQEPYATDVFLVSMFEGGLVGLSIGLLAYTTKEEVSDKGYKYGGVVEVDLGGGRKKKIRGDRPIHYTTGKGANNLVNGNDAPGYTDNFNAIYGSQELRDFINSKLK